MSELTNCPQCPRHCPVDALSCGRGRAYFQGNENEQSGNMEAHERGAHGHGKHEHERRGPLDKESLPGLMRICGHTLFHRSGDDVDLFAALSAQEQEQLKTLLKKLVASWE